jgi:hypothetical protein
MGKIGNILGVSSFVMVFVFLFILAILVTVINANIDDLTDYKTNVEMFKTINSVGNWVLGLWLTVGLTFIVIGIAVGVLIFLYNKNKETFDSITGKLTGSTVQTIMPIAGIVFLCLFILLLSALIYFIVTWYRSILSSVDYQVYQEGCVSIEDKRCNEIFSNFDTIINAMVFVTILAVIAIILSIVAIVFLVRNRNN